MFFQRCLVSVVKTMPTKLRRWLNYCFQPNILVETVLIKVDNHHCFYVDSKLICLQGKNEPHLDDSTQKQ